MAKYRVSGTLQHGVAVDDGKGNTSVRVDVYHDGDVVDSDELVFARDHDKNIAALLVAGTLLTDEKYLEAAAAEGNVAAVQQLATEREAKDQRIADLEAQLAEFQAAQASSKKSSKAEAD